MKFSCPHCGKHIEAQDSQAGMIVACPYSGCGQQIKIPVLAPLPSRRPRVAVSQAPAVVSPQIPPHLNPKVFSTASPPKHAASRITGVSFALTPRVKFTAFLVLLAATVISEVLLFYFYFYSSDSASPWAFVGACIAFLVANVVSSMLPMLSQAVTDNAAAAPASARRVGDAADEHRTMKRGSFDASSHVGLAFLYEVATVSAIFISYLWTPLKALVGAEIILAVGVLAGFGFALLIFWNRWMCIEALSSRFCCGVYNVSFLFVPLIAFIYANVRGIMKLFGR